jgi:chromosome segregation ATPase
MVKKLFLLSAIGVGSVVALAGTGMFSYLRMGYSTASSAVRDAVPIEWEIKHARQMIEDLKPEISKNLQVVAREEAGVKRLAEEIQAKEAVLAKGRNDIMRLKGDLESGSVKFVYAGRSYTEDQVKEDLSNRFKQFQVHEQTTSKLNQVLTAREKNLEAARRKLDSMLAAKRELEVEVENLQARMTMVQVAQTASHVAIDDSHLSETRRLLESIRTRIDVTERLVASEGALDGAIPLDEETSPSLLQEIADYFGDGRAEIESLVSSSRDR